MNLHRITRPFLMSFVLVVATISVINANDHIITQPDPAIEGRWDITIDVDGKESPSWLEIRHSGSKRLIGQFVGITGSARPVSIVHFKDGKRSTNVYFSPKGAIDYRVNYYFEDELPREVRHTVKSNFYDYFITHVSEVHKGDFVCYFVKIEDKTSIKTVRVTDDEYEVIEELTKQL